MTRIDTDSTSIQRTQIQPGIAPNLRTFGESGAGTFGALFARKTAPDPAASPADELAEARDASAGETKATDATDTGDDADTSRAEASDSDASPRDNTDAKDQNGREPIVDENAGKPDAGATETKPQGDHLDAQLPLKTVEGADDKAGRPLKPEEKPIAASGKPGDEARESEPAKAFVPVAEAAKAAPITGHAQVRAELKNAAAVDLASLAKLEQLQPIPENDWRPAQPNRPDTNDAGPDRRPIPQPPRIESAGTNGQAGTPVESPHGKPPPGFLSPQFRPDTGATHGASAHTAGKTPSDPGDVLTATNPARGAGGATGQGEAGHRAELAAARAVFLDRLANSGAARRGAVSAVDKVNVAERLALGQESRATQQRPIAFKPVDPPPPTRDAFLSPVQRGLGKMLAEGGGKLTVMLRPQELGDVRIAMETKSGRVRVRMEASSEAARKVLESGLESLRSTLESRGVKVETMEVTTAERQDPTPAGERDTGDGQRHSPGQGRQGGNPATPHERESQDAPDDAGLTNDQAQRLWTELGIDAVA